MMIKSLVILFSLIAIISCSEKDVPKQEINFSTPLSNNFRCGSQNNAIKANFEDTSYTLFESGAVNPLAWSDDGTQLYVINPPANCLEIYDVNHGHLSFSSSVMVGLEPVSLAVYKQEIWVVNQLSDSVSIVDISGEPYVKQTLNVGDEPMDIVFAGSNQTRAFINTAHRGQNHPNFQVEELFSDDNGRADVWVYDANNPGDGLNGTPIKILNLFTDSTRGMAVSHDKKQVYVASFYSTNNTTVINEHSVKADQKDKPAPINNIEGEPQPPTGLIVKYNVNTQKWLDEANQDWTNHIPFRLADQDLYIIDAEMSEPAVSKIITGVGTTIYNIASNPINNKLYVSNTDANNHIRFEGTGSNSSTVRGNNVIHQISIIDPSSDKTTPETIINLNPHISSPSASAADKKLSIATPTDMAIPPDGKSIYIAALGSGKVMEISIDQLEKNQYQPNTATVIELPEKGPTGVALSPDQKYLAAYTRFNNGISIYEADSDILISQVEMFTPEPNEIVAGRPFLYDANLTSSNGTGSCSNCHIYGTTDRLGWDLGDPDAKLKTNNNQYLLDGFKNTDQFHPMKGPMTTQTLKGLQNHGPMHWRGDRTGENRKIVRGQLESLESAAFKEFNSAFVALGGRNLPISEDNMQKLTDFALALTPPPNPIHQFDKSLTPAQKRGQDVFFIHDTIPALGEQGRCGHCHPINPNKGLFGSAGLMHSELPDVSQDIKIPNLREVYTKLGMFGTTHDIGDKNFTGAQIKGFGLLHDGAMDTLTNFLEFALPFELSKAQMQDLSHFIVIMESNLAPIVGQQVTLSAQSSQEEYTRWELLESRALVSKPRQECDLIFNGKIDEQYHSGMLLQTGLYEFHSDQQISHQQMRSLIQQQGTFITFTCVPPNNGKRIALNKK